MKPKELIYKTFEEVQRKVISLIKAYMDYGYWNFPDRDEISIKVFPCPGGFAYGFIRVEVFLPRPIIFFPMLPQSKMSTSSRVGERNAGLWGQFFFKYRLPKKAK